MRKILFKILLIIISSLCLAYTSLFVLKFHDIEFTRSWEWTSFIGIDEIVRWVKGFMPADDSVKKWGVVILEAGMLLFFAYNTIVFALKLIPFIAKIFKAFTGTIWVLSLLLIAIGAVWVFVDFDGNSAKTLSNIVPFLNF
ncbi:MAG: hypothetical protein ACRC42_03850 [Mycoplasma sp.]